MKRTTEWTCDICEKTEIVQNNEINDGINIPDFWMQGEICFRDDRNNLYLKTLLCKSCKEKFIDRRSYYSAKHGFLPFKKTIWQKIFGVKS